MADESTIDWRTLSEQTGYRVLTLPDGSTVSASEIVAVRFADDSFGYAADLHPRRVIIDTRRMVGACVVTEEPTDFFAIATEAHRRARAPKQSATMNVRAAWGPDVTITHVDGPRVQSLTISNERGEVLCRVEGEDLHARALAAAEFYSSKVGR